MIKAKMSVAAEGSRLAITIYEDIESDSWWSVSNTSSKSIKNALDENPGVQFIDIYINSYGGEVKEGVAIYNLLKRSDAYVTAYIDGFACSIASVIAMAADKVVMHTTSLMMIHHAWTYTAGNAAELRKAADDLEIIDSASKQAYLMHAGEKLSEEKLNELLDNESWLNAQTCVDYGLADEIGDFEAVSISEPEPEPEDPALEKAKTTYEEMKVKFKEFHQKNVFSQMKDSFKNSEKGEINHVN